MPIKKEEEESNLSYKKLNSTKQQNNSKRSRSNSNSSNYSNQEIPGAMTIKELEQHVDQQEQNKQRPNSDQNSMTQTGKTKRHPNYDQHELDEKYSKKSQAFIERFYSEQEVQKILLTQAAAAPKKLPSPNSYAESQLQAEQKNDLSTRADSLDVRSHTSSTSENNLNINFISSLDQCVIRRQKQDESQNEKIQINYSQIQQTQLNNNNSNMLNDFFRTNQNNNQNIYSTNPNTEIKQSNQLFQFASKTQFQSNNYNNNFIGLNNETMNINPNIPKSQIPNLLNDNFDHNSQEGLLPYEQSYDDNEIFEQKNKMQKSNYQNFPSLEIQFQHDHTQSYAQYQKDDIQNYGSIGHELQQQKSQNGLHEYENQQQFQELGIEDQDMYDHHYFNIFEDESLGCKFEELQQEQKKLHKMIYHQHYY